MKKNPFAFALVALLLVVGCTSSPAPPGRVLQKPDLLKIQPDSVLRISVHEDPGLSGSYKVNDLGTIRLGYIGPVVLYDMTEDEAADKIEQHLVSRKFRSATVSVKIVDPPYDWIRITGTVNRPGLIKVPVGETVTLNDALVRAGGIRVSQLDARVKVVRGRLTTASTLYMTDEAYSLVNEEGTHTYLTSRYVMTMWYSYTTAVGKADAKEIRRSVG